jgi:hypothetical protein
VLRPNQNLHKISYTTELSALSQAHWIAPEPPMPFQAKERKKESSILILGSNTPYEDKLPPTRGPKQGVVGFRINDSVANGLIFTAAAAIIGSQLLKK